jgi:hypothetical protein
MPYFPRADIMFEYSIRKVCWNEIPECFSGSLPCVDPSGESFGYWRRGRRA